MSVHDFSHIPHSFNCRSSRVVIAIGCLPLSASLLTIPLDIRSQWTAPVHNVPWIGTNTITEHGLRRGYQTRLTSVMSLFYPPQPCHVGITCRCVPRRDRVTMECATKREAATRTVVLLAAGGKGPGRIHYRHQTRPCVLGFAVWDRSQTNNV